MDKKQKVNQIAIIVSVGIIIVIGSLFYWNSRATYEDTMMESSDKMMTEEVGVMKEDTAVMNKEMEGAMMEAEVMMKEKTN